MPRVFGRFFLFIFACAKGEAAREKLWEHRYKLFSCGFAMGFTWIFLFKAFASTTVAAAVICYYMAPIFVLFFRPLVLGNN
ncbi:EamA family transporter [Acidaminococcus intestini]|nr:EamA family transporter [Acidaminococcus intestini]